MFAHGLTAKCTLDNISHGRSLLISHGLYGRSGTALVLSRANTGASGIATMTLTLSGVKVCGYRLAEEIHVMRKIFPNVVKLSFVGASMGGLFVRYAANLLFSSQSFLFLHGISPHAMITLATPHLGVYGLVESYHLVYWCSWLALAPGELLLQNDSLLTLALAKINSEDCTSETVEHLFPVKVSYAPLFNDGVVAWESSACSLQRLQDTKPSEGHQVLRGERRLLFEPDHKCQWIPESDSKAEIVLQICRAMASTSWNIVDVHLPHSQLATLYPYTSNDECVRNAASFEISNAILERILGKISFSGRQNFREAKTSESI